MRFTDTAGPAVMNSDSVAPTTSASTSSSAISPCQTSISIGAAIVSLPQPRASVGAEMEARQPPSKRGRDLVVDRPTLLGDLVGRDPAPSLLADEHEFVAVGYTRHSAHIDGEAVHADRPDDRHALPSDERRPVVGVDARPAIAVADPQRRDARGLLRAKAEPVADRLAGIEIEDAERQRLQRQCRAEADLALRRPVRQEPIEADPRSHRSGERYPAGEDAAGGTDMHEAGFDPGRAHRVEGLRKAHELDLGIRVVLAGDREVAHRPREPE